MRVVAAAMLCLYIVVFAICSVGIQGIDKFNAIRMPHDVVGEDNKFNDGEPFTKHIIGRDGLCVDARNGCGIQLWPCGNQTSQQWTFNQDDGTIRSMGKCMTANGLNSGSYIMIFDCSAATEDATKWEVTIDGSIINLSSGLVMTAPSGASGTTLVLENNFLAASQGWTVSNDVQPNVTLILGLENECLQDNDELYDVWLEYCDGTREQEWVLFGDHTIRGNRNHGLCLTSSGYVSKDVIIMFKCQGLPTQRWFFKSDGTIVNPNTTLVMDVKDSNVYLLEIIIFPATGNPNQQWRTEVLPS